jgi:hypothetical protein
MHHDGNTNDIIKCVLWADNQKEHKEDLKKFAPQLKRGSTLDTCYAVWKFVKYNINYVLDPLGEQYIKSPSKTWADKFADCKSRSIFITSLLKNLNIPYAYRFASYTGAYPYTHVYVVAKPSAGVQYILDPDMGNFNIEKPTTYFKDYNMSKIEYLAGIGENGEREGRLTLYKPVNEMTDLDMDLAIRKQREEINKNIIESVSGIGCPHAEKVQDRIDAYNDIIEVRSSTLSVPEQINSIGMIIDQFDEGKYDVSKQVSGIGNIGSRKSVRKAKKAERKAERKAVTQRVKAARKSGNKQELKAAKKGRRQFIKKKITSNLKKAGKGLLKVATAPQRLAVKGILEATLPKMAPLFIYLFIKDQNIINKMPEKARRQRKVAERFAKFITNNIGMKESHFMGIVRNGIMKRYKTSPEQVLSKSLKMNINGIGDIGYVQIIAVAVKILGKIIKLFKGKKNKEAGDLEKDLKEAGEPDLQNDFASASEEEKEELSKEILKQPKSEEEAAPGESGTGKEYDEDGKVIPSPNSRTSRISPGGN